MGGKDFLSILLQIFFLLWDREHNKIIGISPLWGAYP